MSKTLRSILALLVFIFLVGTACNLSASPTLTSVIPTTVSPHNQPGDQPTKEPLRTTEPELKPNQISISVTDAQITAQIAEKLPNELDAILSNPEVKFKPGQVELLATLNGDIISADGRVVMSITIDPDGKPIMEVLEANFGPFPIPSSLLNNLSTAVENAITDSMQDYQSEYRLESINFTTGVATIVLSKK